MYVYSNCILTGKERLKLSVLLAEDSWRLIYLKRVSFVALATPGEVMEEEGSSQHIMEISLATLHPLCLYHYQYTYLPGKV